MQLSWSGQAQGGILYNKWYLSVCQETYTGNSKKASVKTWTISKFSSKWHSVDFLLHHWCDDELCDLVEVATEKFMAAQGYCEFTE